MNNAPIGVFDSGLGGLTTVRELRRILPQENIIYFGDTGRVPYGSRSKETIISYAKQDIAFLLEQKVKTIVAACGTVSSTLPQEVVRSLPVSYSGVVAPAAKAAVQATRNKRVGIIGTEATIRSGSYQREIQMLAPDVECVATACPLFVPLVENGHFGKNDQMAELAVQEYLAAIKQAGVDTLVLGCTHYPLLADTLQRYMGQGVALVDPGREAAQALYNNLQAEDALADNAADGTICYYVSDEPSRFAHYAKLFMGDTTDGRVQQVSVEQYVLPE